MKGSGAMRPELFQASSRSARIAIEVRIVLTNFLVASLATFIFLSPTKLGAQTRPDAAQLFEKTEVMIPMRDGVKLHTIIFSPRTRTQPLPFIFKRTPYG